MTSELSRRGTGCSRRTWRPPCKTSRTCKKNHPTTHNKKNSPIPAHQFARSTHNIAFPHTFVQKILRERRKKRTPQRRQQQQQQPQLLLQLLQQQQQQQPETERERKKTILDRRQTEKKRRRRKRGHFHMQSKNLHL